MIYSSITDPIKIKYAYKVSKNISEDYPDDWNVPPAAVVVFILVLNKQTLSIHFLIQANPTFNIFSTAPITYSKTTGVTYISI